MTGITSPVSQSTQITLPEQYIILDIETTGFNFSKDRIIEIAAIKYSTWGEVSIFSSLVNPEMPIPYHITNLTGISEKQLDGAPVWSDIQQIFLDFIGDCPLIGHNIISFDIPFINEAIGFQLSNCLIDTLDLSKQAYPELPNHKLSYLKTVFGIDVQVSHRALDDVKSTYFLLQSLLSQAAPVINLPVCANKVKHIHGRNKISDIIPSANAKQNSALRGKLIVFTGSLTIERNEAMQIAVDAGATVRSGVSKRTDYLVVGQQDPSVVGPDGMSAKERDAHNLNESGKAKISIITEERFLELAQEEGVNL